MPWAMMPALRSPGPQPAFVGRDHELALLGNCLGQGAQGQLQTVFITGNTGAGKTALANTFLEQVRQRGDAWSAHGQCIQQYGAGEAYMPVLEAFARLARSVGSQDVVDVLRAQGPSWLAQIPALLDAEDAELLRRRGAATPERMLREMAEVICALSERRPIVLLFEDLQWADYSTLNLISYLGRRADPMRAMLIGTYRSTDVERLDHPLGAIQRDLQVSGRCKELRLEDLTEGAVAQYVAARLTPHELPSSVIRLLRERTNGAPLFMVKLLDSWLERELIVQSGVTWRLGGELPELARMVPETVSRMIVNEIERLPASERSILEAACVAGVEFSVDSVAAALRVDAPEIERACSAWARSGRFLKLVGEGVWPDGGVALRFAFLHGLYQQVAYELIVGSTRAELHRCIAEHLEEAHRGQVDGIAIELAVHFERGRCRLPAAKYLVAAGGVALRRSAYLEAIDHFERGLAVLRGALDAKESSMLELELQVGLGAALAMTRGYSADVVDRAYGRARHLCAHLGDVVALYPVVIEGIWKYYYARGDCRTAGELAAQCHALAEESLAGMVLRREARLMIGVSCFYLGRFEEAQMHLEGVLRLFAADPSCPEVSAYKEDSHVAAHAGLGWTLWLRGYPDLALRRAGEAVRMARQLEHPFTLAFALYFLLVVRGFRGEIEAGLEVAAELAALASEQGFVFYAAVGGMVSGWLTAIGGQRELGLRSFEAGWAVYSRMGAGVGGPFFRCCLAEILATLGREEEARSHVACALDAVRKNDDLGWEPELYRLQGELSTADAEPCFERALGAARQLNSRSLELRAAISLAGAWRARGRSAEARKLVSDVSSRFNEGSDTLDLKRARQFLSQ